MRRLFVLGVLVLAGGLSIWAAGAAELQGPNVFDIQQVEDNLYVIGASSPDDRSTFAGGNTAVFVTEAGVVIVDTKLPGWGERLLEKIRTVTDKPVTTVINTHTHGDHVGSNEFFGATVDSIVHENTKTNMVRMDQFAGDKAQFLPKRTFADTATLGSGKDQIDLHYFGAGHTNGDAFVVFSALRILHTGDMFAWKDAPFIDRSNGGSGVAMPETLEKALAGLPDVDRVITGHHPVLPRADLEEWQRFNADVLAAVRTAHGEGKTATEAAASIDLSEQYPDYKFTRIPAAVEAIYDELGPQ